jgi:hypothetical protein
MTLFFVHIGNNKPISLQTFGTTSMREFISSLCLMPMKDTEQPTIFSKLFQEVFVVELEPTPSLDQSMIFYYICKNNAKPKRLNSK